MRSKHLCELIWNGTRISCYSTYRQWQRILCLALNQDLFEISDYLLKGNIQDFCRWYLFQAIFSGFQLKEVLCQVLLKLLRLWWFLLLRMTRFLQVFIWVSWDTGVLEVKLHERWVNQGFLAESHHWPKHTTYQLPNISCWTFLCQCSNVDRYFH